ncbi:MAG: transcription-repair coupling factor, partial [Pseudomonadota bacterium]
MKYLNKNWQNHKNLMLSPVANGLDALLIQDFFKASKNNFIIYISRNDKNMQQIIDNIKFTIDDIDILQLPAWDCLPYDRISPAKEIISKRIECLVDLTTRDKAENSSKKTILITTSNALIQKLPPQHIWEKHIINISVDANLARQELLNFLVYNSYIRSDNAMTAGEFAVRGSIIDIVPYNDGTGYRIDFFGDIVESIKIFDPITQISSKKLNNLTLYPANEIILSQKFIDNFCKKYPHIFGPVNQDDDLYHNIQNGVSSPGMEHWLPLFYDNLSSIYDYIPQDSLIIFDHLASEAINERQMMIDEYYQARIDAYQNGFYNEIIYHPIKPNLLFHNVAEIDDLIAKNNCQKVIFSEFKLPAAQSVSDEETIHSNNIAVETLPNFYAETKLNNETAISLVVDFITNKILTKNNITNPYHIIICCFTNGSIERIRNLLKSYNIETKLINQLMEMDNISSNIIGLTKCQIKQGFIIDNLVFISEQDIFGERYLTQTKAKKIQAQNIINNASNLHEGELIVHREHGIGRFVKLETLTVQDKLHDFIMLIYANDDKLYVPIENMDMISRYGTDDNVKLDKLGSLNWQERHARQKKRIQIAAEELLRIAAERELEQAYIINFHAILYDEFCSKFPYIETEDQLNAVEDIKNDLTSGKPMDRLICGDVGFGKTEIALRAAFMIIADNIASNKAENISQNNNILQVAIIAPTTLLARQHYNNFKERFKDFPITIGQLSRMVSTKEAKAITEKIAAGTIDIIIGTHALLAKNISFKNLAMIIIDEEQHFGVAQKEKLKSLCNNIHVLTLTATPIPRTLQMSLSGIKTISLLANPPIDRKAVRTYVMPYDKIVIKDAILREYYREGQIFYVCSRINELDEIYNNLTELVPEIKIVMAHGKMSSKQLDEIMNNFYEGKFDLLLSTTIVESGLDVAKANTIIIHRSNNFGLAQLYQLRGRVGRSNIRAYAYLTIPPKLQPTENAYKRLNVMQSLDSLGAGFTIASHDMNIRGFGNLVGDEQSGHIKEVGLELYQQMLKEAVKKAKKKKFIANNNEQSTDSLTDDEDWRPSINLGLSVIIPTAYVSNLSVRMELYSRISYLETENDINNFSAEMVDRFGELPQEVCYLFETVKIKQLCVKANIDKLDVGTKATVIGFRNNYFSKPENLLNFINKNKHLVKLRNDHKLVYMCKWHHKDQMLSDIKVFLS